jgi:predicted RNase H-like HicB family nuclease
MNNMTYALKTWLKDEMSENDHIQKQQFQHGSIY